MAVGGDVVCHFLMVECSKQNGSNRSRERLWLLCYWNWKFMIFICIFPVNSHSINGPRARKPVSGGSQTKQVLTSLRIRAVWSAPLLFAYCKVSYLDLLRAKFDWLASLCYCAGWGFLATRPKLHWQSQWNRLFLTLKGLNYPFL